MHAPEFARSQQRSDSPVFCLPDKKSNQSFHSNNLNKSKSQNDNLNDSFGSFGKQENGQVAENCSFSNDLQNQNEQQNYFGQIQQQQQGEPVSMPNFGSITKEDSFEAEPRFGQIESETQINCEKNQKVQLQEELLQLNQQFVRREFQFQQTISSMQGNEQLAKSCMIYFKVKLALNQIANIFAKKKNSYKIQAF